MKEKLKKNKYIIAAIVVGIMLILSLMLSGTYAFWTITQTQSSSNQVVGRCLNFEMKEASEGINLENAIPVSDYEGMQLEGFTFTIENMCEEPQDYRIELDSLVEKDANYMNNKYIATLLDYGVKVPVSDLEVLPEESDDIREKHTLAYDTVLGKTTNTHTLRLWIDESSIAEEQLKTFLSKVSISAGQGIKKYYTPEECFVFDSATGSITDYDDSCGGTDVVIPYQFNVEGTDSPVAVTTIGSNAFAKTNLASVELPRSVDSILSYAFQNNGELQKVIFKDGLTSIGNLAFSKGSFYDESLLLETVILPATMKTVSKNAFSKTGIVNLKMYEGLVSIGESAFGDNNIKKLTIPNSVTTLTWAAFKDNQISELTIGTGITRIDNWMFSGNAISEVVIPDNVIEIGEKAFYDVPIEKLTLSNNLVTIESNAFNRIALNSSPITKLTIPNSVTTIGASAFGALNANATVTVQRSSDDYTPFGAVFGNANVVYEVQTTETTE